MSSELESRIYRGVLRAVMWGTERAEVFEMLRVNGITGEPAEEMFRRARGQRIAVLCNEAMRKVAKGALLLAAGIALFSGFWFGMGAITRSLFMICGFLTAWGLWWFLGGAMDALLASNKKGSVAPGGD